MILISKEVLYSAKMFNNNSDPQVCLKGPLLWYIVVMFVGILFLI